MYSAVLQNRWIHCGWHILLVATINVARYHVYGSQIAHVILISDSLCKKKKKGLVMKYDLESGIISHRKKTLPRSLNLMREKSNKPEDHISLNGFFPANKLGTDSPRDSTCTRRHSFSCIHSNGGHILPAVRTPCCLLANSVTSAHAPYREHCRLRPVAEPWSMTVVEAGKSSIFAEGGN